MSTHVKLPSLDVIFDCHMDTMFMKDFLRDRKHLEFINKYVSFSEEERPHLFIKNPAILATFMGYLKFQAWKLDQTKEVFFRGQVRNHKAIIPSLLRGDDFEQINRLSDAYSELKSRTQKLFKSASRFANETIDNFFQQYGIKSKTLDLVDNIYIALWFGTNCWKKISDSNNLCTYERSKEKFGWIYFMWVEGPNKNESSSPAFYGACDLRKFHSSLSARLHCQQGITYYRDNNNKDWDKNNRCFDNLVIASVKFPNVDSFRIDGGFFTGEFLFPNPKIDNTYKMLLEKKFSTLLLEIEKEYNIENGELGTIWSYKF